MKKHIAFPTLVLLICVTGSLSAQQSFEFGIRLNPEFTQLVNKNDKNAGAELDPAQHFGYLSFGAGAAYYFNSHIGIGLDILFSREGQAFTGDLGNSIDSAAYSTEVVTQSFLAGDSLAGKYKALSELNFIKLPIMLSLSTDHEKALYFNCLVGPQINFIEGVAQEVNGEDHLYPNTNIEPKDLYKPVTLDGMLALGIGFNLIPHLLLTAHFRVDYGFADIEKKDAKISYAGSAPVNFYSSSRSSTHNMTEGLLVGINFKL